jgi:ADP-ribose pyrophosphatase
MSVGNEPPEILEQKLAYKGRKFDYEVIKLRLPNGVAGEWECIRHPGGALAVPVTSDGKFVLVKQYRFTVEGRLLEFPAGTVESQESPFETIKREIEEETGYRANKWQDMGKFILAPGYSDEYIYAFLAQDLEKLATPPQQDEDEDIEVVLMSEEELEAAILAGEPIDGKSIASFYMARAYLRGQVSNPL